MTTLCSRVVKVTERPLCSTIGGLVFTRKSMTCVSAVAVISALAFGAAPAVADDSAPDSSSLAALQELTSSTTEPQFRPLDNVALVPTDVTDKAAIDATVEGTNFVVPSDARSPLTLTNGEISLGITLPFSDLAGGAQKLSEGVVAHDNTNGSVTVPIVKEDGIVQIATVINQTSAPRAYEYEFTVAGGADVSIDNGTVIVRTSSGEFAGMVTPASAKDANGVDVPTHYELDGNHVTQVVEHGDSYEYPIVIAPAASQTFFTSANVDTWSGQSRVNLTPGWWTYAVAAPLMDIEGWNEAVSAWGGTVRNALRSKTSMRQQFSCHAYGSWFAGQWNLEKARPTRTVSWTYGVAIHHCNWTTAAKY